MDLSKAKIGDRFTVEFQVERVSPDHTIRASVVSENSFHCNYFSDMTPVKSFTPKPPKLEIGMTFPQKPNHFGSWKIVAFEGELVIAVSPVLSTNIVNLRTAVFSKEVVYNRLKENNGVTTSDSD